MPLGSSLTLRRAGTGAGPPRERRRPRLVRSPQLRRPLRWALRGMLAFGLVVTGYVGVTIYPYLTGPGTDSVSARVAEWARDHHLSWAVTWLENETYTPPPTGGGLSAAQRRQLLGTAAPSNPRPSASATRYSDQPVNIPVQAANPLPGEGVWHPVTFGPAGSAVVEEAALRPDARHTSELAYAVWMNQRALAFTLQPGYQQPGGGSWPVADSVAGSGLKGLVATWNGGFKIHPDDALGGYYADGITAAPLVAGKAAEVFYRDGSLRIGAWGSGGLTMAPDVAAVRENLDLLVSGGSVRVSTGAGSGAQWGYTINNDYYIARSGVGITATGDIVYVSGSALSVATLAHLLKAAGAVNAMELDINPDWISFMTYSGNPAAPHPVKLWNFVQPAGRYLQPASRDFVSVHLR